MKNGVIYKITSPSGKIYIGQSTEYKARLSKYKRLICKDQPALYNSFIKHGFENHKFEIIMENLPTKEHMNMWERLFIYLEDSHKNGLNCTDRSVTTIL